MNRLNQANEHIENTLKGIAMANSNLVVITNKKPFSLDTMDPQVNAFLRAAITTLGEVLEKFAQVSADMHENKKYAKNSEEKKILDQLGKAIGAEIRSISGLLFSFRNLPSLSDLVSAIQKLEEMHEYLSTQQSVLQELCKKLPGI
jgi:hypothetical protein